MTKDTHYLTPKVFRAKVQLLINGKEPQKKGKEKDKGGMKKEKGEKVNKSKRISKIGYDQKERKCKYA